MHEGTTQPSRYRVVVRGRVGSELAGTFEHLELDSNGGESSLTGTFADQAQLLGLLDRLQDLGIPIVSVNPVADAAHGNPTERSSS
jgi:hypothetical protein